MFSMTYTARPLTDADTPALARLCAQDRLKYLTPRMNLEVHGCHSDLLKAWGAFTPDGVEIAGLLLRFGNTAIVADENGDCASVFAPLIDAEEGLAGVRGTAECVRRVRGLLRRYGYTGMERSLFLTLLRPPNISPELLAKARPARLEDLDALTELYRNAHAMYRSRENVARNLANSRVFVAEEAATTRCPARIVSCALLNIEHHEAGLIGGVYTTPEARGRGYAAACTAALAQDLQRGSKLPCLFYENPVAGRVYRRLGFQDACQWAVLYLTNQPVRR